MREPAAALLIPSVQRSTGGDAGPSTRNHGAHSLGMA